MAKQIIIKPVITEKSDQLTEKRGQYTFVVAKDANKIEIKKAVAEMFNVEVKAVNTMVMPAKAKRRNTRNGIIKGRVSSYKKAVVTLAEGEEINFFGDL
ncbi:MAG: 50S ribosomal protein L23 [Saprospiraceae bacterium]|nr:MAG: 50S ribosomal protein L23 [Saprospiraceae bacterium]